MTKTTPLLFLLDVDFDLVSPISLAISASLREKTELQNPHRRGRRPSRAEYFVSGSDSSASRPCQHSRSFVSIRGSNNLRKSAQSAGEIWLRLCRARFVRARPRSSVWLFHRLSAAAPPPLPRRVSAPPPIAQSRIHAITQFPPPPPAPPRYARAAAVEPRTTSDVGSKSLHSVISPRTICSMRLHDSIPTWCRS